MFPQHDHHDHCAHPTSYKKVCPLLNAASRRLKATPSVTVKTIENTMKNKLGVIPEVGSLTRRAA
jgi:hypothetical protein